LLFDLNEKQYLRLSDICDRILLAKDSTIERVAIGWLHIIREHPVFLSRYHEVFKNDIEIKNKAIKWIRKIKYEYLWFRNFIRVIRDDKKISNVSQENPSRIDVLFVSHLINPALASQPDDFYFGSLPCEMLQCKRSVVVALINHTTKSCSDYSDISSVCSYPRVILSGSLRFLDEIVLHSRLKNQAKVLDKRGKHSDTPFERRIHAKASIEALTEGPHRNMRIAAQIGGLVAKLRPKAIIITYEGHAWERLVFAAARQAAPGIKCIGYQHAALFRLQHAIRRNLAPEYNPDLILTAGYIGKAELEAACGLNGIPVSVLGSNRSIRNNIDKNRNDILVDTPESPYYTTCLVIPEGIASECNLLFEFSLSCAKAFPNILFIWRLHPIVSFESLIKSNPKLQNLPKNILLSTVSLENDFARSIWALYRGTTAIVQAVASGLRPIYLKLPDEMSIDPLFGMNYMRNNVTAVNEFMAVISTSVERSKLKSDMLDAANYCKNIFVPFDVEMLDKSIEK